VSLEVDLKNVPTLLVKVFEIDAVAYYSAERREIDATLELEGLMPTAESTLSFEDQPFLRRREKIDLPALDHAGVWVVELIGNGISSRAVVRKGRLRYHDRCGSAGHRLRVFDEAGLLQKDAAILLGGREFAADEDGDILIPYSADPGKKSIVLTVGHRATLDEFAQASENYSLKAGFHVDREALLEDNRASMVMRSNLLLNGRPISLEVLEDPVLVITSIDRDGISSSLEVKSLKLDANHELVQQITVPPGLRSLRASLRGTVRSISLNRDLTLTSDSAYFPLNLIEDTDLTACPLLGRKGTSWTLDILGLNGEPVPNRVVTVRLEHRDFNDDIEVAMQTDAAGRIDLGALEGIESVAVLGVAGDFARWNLRKQARSYADRITATAGEELYVPYQGDATRLSSSVMSLIEIRNGKNVRNCFEKASIEKGQIVVRGLEPGDYRLALHEARVDIEI
ncbi:MAG: hypothetical protein KDB18_14265, partial [Salinibacterium sp.]|nr:hypothetical protein [Salinibacterium sp.]